MVEDVLELPTSNEIVVVDFWAPWCGPCRSIAPSFKEWAEKHPEAKFVKVNVDDASKLAQEFNINYIPQIYVIKGDRKIKVEGMSEEKIVAAINQLK
jgi:thioredoxin